MTDAKRIADLEARLAAAEATLAKAVDLLATVSWQCERMPLEEMRDAGIKPHLGIYTPVDIASYLRGAQQ